MEMMLLLKRDVLLAARSPGEWAIPLIFLVAVSAVFPLALGPAPEVLSRIAPGLIWAIALLCSLLTQDALFRDDAEDGALEQLLLAPQSLVMAVLGKAAAHWVSSAIPLIVLAPMLGAWMHMDGQDLAVLMLSLPLGTGIFSLLAVFAASLAAGTRRGNFLGALLALPLCMPAVIFAAAAVTTADSAAALLLLAALFAFLLTVMPFAAAGALRAAAQGL